MGEGATAEEAHEEAGVTITGAGVDTAGVEEEEVTMAGIKADGEETEATEVVTRATGAEEEEGDIAADTEAGDAPGTLFLQCNLIGLVDIPCPRLNIKMK